MSGTTPSVTASGPSTVVGVSTAATAATATGANAVPTHALSFPVTPMRTPENARRRATELIAPFLTRKSSITESLNGLSADIKKKDAELHELVKEVAALTPLKRENIIKLQGEEATARMDASSAASSASSASSAIASSIPRIDTYTKDLHITITDALFVFLGRCIPVSMNSSSSSASASASATDAPSYLWMFNELWSRLKNYLQSRNYTITLGKLVGLDDLDVEDIVFLKTVCPVLDDAVDPDHPYNITKRTSFILSEREIWKQTLYDCIGFACVTKMSDGTSITLLSLGPSLRPRTLLFELSDPKTIYIYFTHTQWHISIMRGVVVDANRVQLYRERPDLLPFTIHLTGPASGGGKTHLYLVVPPTIRSMSPKPCLERNSRMCYCGRILIDRFNPGPTDERMWYGKMPAAIASSTSAEKRFESRSLWAVNGPHTPLRSLANVTRNVSTILSEEEKLKEAFGKKHEESKEAQIKKRLEEENEKRRKAKEETESRRNALRQSISANKSRKQTLDSEVKQTSKNYETIDAQIKAINTMFSSFIGFIEAKTDATKRSFLKDWDDCFTVLQIYLETNPNEDSKTIVLSFLFEVLSQFPSLLGSLTTAEGEEEEAIDIDAITARLNKIKESIDPLIRTSEVLKKGNGFIQSLVDRLSRFKDFYLAPMPTKKMGGYRYTRRNLKNYRSKRNNTRK